MNNQSVTSEKVYTVECINSGGFETMLKVGEIYLMKQSTLSPDCFQMMTQSGIIYSFLKDRFKVLG